MYPSFTELETRREIVVSTLNGLRKQKEEIDKQIELLDMEILAIDKTIDLHNIHNAKVERKE